MNQDNVIHSSVSLWKDTIIRRSRISAHCSIGDYSQVNDSHLDKYVEIGRRNTVIHSQIGIGTYTGEFTFIKYASIGKYCAISWNNSIGGANHSTNTLSLTPINRISHKLGKTILYESWLNDICRVGNDVWLAAGVHVLRGVSIGNGAVIGANSVVTKDIPDYAIAVGCPAKVISFRFPLEIIQQLKEICWWDFPEDILEENIELFQHAINENIIYRLHEIKQSIKREDLKNGSI